MPRTLCHWQAATEGGSISGGPTLEAPLWRCAEGGLGWTTGAGAGEKQANLRRAANGPWEPPGARNQAAVENPSLRRLPGHGACGLVAGSHTAEGRGFLLGDVHQTTGPVPPTRVPSALGGREPSRTSRRLADSWSSRGRGGTRVSCSDHGQGQENVPLVSCNGQSFSLSPPRGRWTGAALSLSLHAGQENLVKAQPCREPSLCGPPRHHPMAASAHPGRGFGLEEGPPLTRTRLVAL